MPTDPLYNEIDASNLESVRRNVVYNNLFVGTPFQAKLRRAGVWDEFLGGAGMMEGILYGRTQGAAVNPGQTITVTRQQINTGIKFLPKAYATWYPLDDWEMDDGSGTGGVINSGPSKIVDEYQLYMENLVLTMNTMQEMDSFRHGQAASATVFDSRTKTINGLDEALSNGIDPSVYGNIYKSYGGQQRNGNVGMALNSTPIYCGTPTGGTGQIDFAVLMQLWSQCKVTGGSPSLGITNVFGFKAVAIALDAQRRDISNTRHDIKWDGLNFNGVDIYADPLAPSAQAQSYIALGSGTGGGQGNASLVDGVGSSTTTVAFQTPQFFSSIGAPVPVSPTGSNLPSSQTIQPGEVLYFLEPESFKIRPTNKKGWNFGLRRAPMPNNVSIDALFMRLGINLYNTQPRHNCYAFAFTA
jgi:hypothetical protein